MRRTSRLTLILCLASTASLAQTSVRDRSVVPLETNCPIAIQPTLQKSGNLLGFQRLEVTLTKWPSFPIIASRITVRGIAPAGNLRGPSQITESLDLNRVVDQPRPVASTANVSPASSENAMPWLPPPSQPVIVRVNAFGSRWYAWVSGFTAVNSIDLESVSYADGTSWHASNGTPCRVSVASSVW
jgi:hypothetical protein